MQRDPRAWLWDVHNGAELILTFTQDKSLENYLSDAMLRSAVERQFEIIGEALNQLSRNAPDIAAEIPDLARIVAFRNILIHGYAAVDNATVWRTVETDLPLLHQKVTVLLDREN